MKVFDISMEISEQMLSYPGDRKFTLYKVLELKKGDAVNLSEIRMNVHTGTHLDAPSHYIDRSSCITDIDMNKFFGKAMVYDFTQIEFGTGISERDLMGVNIQEDEIVLLKTQNSEIDRTTFKEDSVFLSRDGAEHLVSRKIKSVGIDYLSIGKYLEDEKTHKILLENDILIYEGLNLRDLLAGEYIFYGFPLKIKGIDGAPVRAVLTKV